MNLVKTIDQYNDNYVYFSEPITNNIINDSKFIRIIYSTPLCILNGIYIYINFNIINIEKYYNKFKCAFEQTHSKHIVERLRIIEEGLLNKVNISNKCPQYKMNEHLKIGNIKVFSETSDQIANHFLLKIAGIWETDTEYGITYKFSTTLPLC